MKKKRSISIRPAVPVPPSIHLEKKGVEGRVFSEHIDKLFYCEEVWTPSDLLAFDYLKSLMMAKTQLRGNVMERLRT